MGRYYHFSKTVSKEESEEILRKMRELENLKSAAITEDRAYLFVTTKDGIFSEVMGAAVNICRRAAGGCELSFDRFSPEKISAI